jgi:hypothetical protein
MSFMPLLVDTGKAQGNFCTNVPVGTEVSYSDVFGAKNDDIEAENSYFRITNPDI